MSCYAPRSPRQPLAPIQDEPAPPAAPSSAYGNAFEVSCLPGSAVDPDVVARQLAQELADLERQLALHDAAIARLEAEWERLLSGSTDCDDLEADRFDLSVHRAIAAIDREALCARVAAAQGSLDDALTGCQLWAA